MSEEKECHPAQGLVQFSRRSGGGHHLFGSDLLHSELIALTIREANVTHKLGRPWYAAQDRVTEVEMSSSQFVQLLTQMNVGEGVPCTFTYKSGARIEKIPPPVKNKIELVAEDMRVAIEETLIKFKAAQEDIMKNLTGKIPKKNLEAIDVTFKQLCQQYTADIPFYVEQMKEAGDKIATEVKAEVESYITAVVQRTGLQALQEQGKLLSDFKGE